MKNMILIFMSIFMSSQLASGKGSSNLEQDLFELVEIGRDSEFTLSDDQLERALQIISVNNASLERAILVEGEIRKYILKDGIYDGFIVPGLLSIGYLLESGDYFSANILGASLGTVDQNIGTFLFKEFGLSSNERELDTYVKDMTEEASNFNEYGEEPFLDSKGELSISNLADTSMYSGNTISWDNFYEKLPSAESCSAGCDDYEGPMGKVGLLVGGVGGAILSSPGVASTVVGLVTGAKVGQEVFEVIGCAGGCVRNMARKGLNNLSENTKFEVLNSSSQENLNNTPANNVNGDSKTDKNKKDEPIVDDTNSKRRLQGYDNDPSRNQVESVEELRQQLKALAKILELKDGTLRDERGQKILDIGGISIEEIEKYKRMYNETGIESFQEKMESVLSKKLTKEEELAFQSKLNKKIKRFKSELKLINFIPDHFSK